METKAAHVPFLLDTSQKIHNIPERGQKKKVYMNKQRETAINLDTVHFELPPDEYDAFLSLLDAQGQTNPSPELKRLMAQRAPWEAEVEQKK